MNNVGLYIHIPFCKYICNYCDFCKKYTNTYDNEKYIKTLIKELEFYKEDFKKIDSIYIGGGTPSSLDLYLLDDLLTFLNKNLDMDNIEEFTIEANPDDVDQNFVDLIVEKKVNRVSLGVQTLNNNILKNIKRGHTKKDVQEALNFLNDKIKNISVDFMFNLPNQTLEDIEETFSFIEKNSKQIKHVSYYSLILEENTILNNENFYGLDEEQESNIYKTIQKNLEELSFNQYEISNFSKEGYSSFHNKKYWQLKEYIGVGLSASSFVSRKRYTTTRSMNDYVNSIQSGELCIVNEEYIDDTENKKEQIIFGLRTKEGIFNNINLTENLIKYFDIKDNFLSIKKEYLFLSNWLILQVLELNDK